MFISTYSIGNKTWKTHNTPLAHAMAYMAGGVYCYNAGGGLSAFHIATQEWKLLSNEKPFDRWRDQCLGFCYRDVVNSCIWWTSTCSISYGIRGWYGAIVQDIQVWLIGWGLEKDGKLGRWSNICWEAFVWSFSRRANKDGCKQGVLFVGGSLPHVCFKLKTHWSSKTSV